jgi:type IV pilus assembly protein PilA
MSLIRLARDCRRGGAGMFQRFHEKRDERGFTLIELLVVILIIAILAAIAIPVFLRQREKGWVSQQQSALKDAATAMESWATENNGDYTGTTIAQLEPGGVNDQGLNYASSVTLVVAANANDYCITATHGDLDAGHDWQVATFDSDEGEPDLANAC